MDKAEDDKGVSTTDPELTYELRIYLDHIRNSANLDYEYALQIIDDGADVNTFDSDRHWSPLLLSLYEDSDTHLKALLQRGADPNLRDKYGHEALHHAAMSGVKGRAKLLIENGANINSADENGWTPLHFAVNHRNLDMVRELLNKNANPFARTSLGDTPLLLAEDMEFPEASALLHRHFSVRHSNRVRVLHARNRKKFPGGRRAP